MPTPLDDGRAVAMRDGSPPLIWRDGILPVSIEAIHFSGRLWSPSYSVHPTSSTVSIGRVKSSSSSIPYS